MTEELKWKEEAAKSRETKFLRGNNGDLHEEAFLVDRRVWSTQLAPYELSIVEGDLYCYGCAKTTSWPLLSVSFELRVWGPDMESTKETLLTKLSDAIGGQLKTLYKSMPKGDA